jgi:cysteine-rich repeat protein
MILNEEECDDKNVKDGDGCSASCKVESGYICYGSTSTCTAACGNGIVTAPESCDDGNSIGGDGCSAACKLEAGYGCTSATPNVCTLLTPEN